MSPSIRKGGASRQPAPTGRWLWDVKKHKPLRTWDIRREPEPPAAGTVPVADRPRKVLGVAFLQEGQRLAAACDDATLWLWDVGRPEGPLPKQAEQQLDGHRGAVLSVAFSLDGQMLATADADGTVRLWDVGTPAPESRGHVLIGHQSPVHGVAFSPDGERLATVGSDWTARLWSVETGEQSGGRSAIIARFAAWPFHPHGDRLATAGLDGGWEPCEIESDDTMGLNEAAGVILHVPRKHRVSTVGEQTAGWLRCRVRAVRQGQSPYDKSPVIEGECLAETIGATAPATNSEAVLGEVLGVSEGVSGQRFRLERGPWCRCPGTSSTYSRWSSTVGSRSGTRCRASPTRRQTRSASSWTTSRARSCSARPCASRTMRPPGTVRPVDGIAAPGPSRQSQRSSGFASTRPAAAGTASSLCSARYSASRMVSQASASVSNGALCFGCPGTSSTCSRWSSTVGSRSGTRCRASPTLMQTSSASFWTTPQARSCSGERCLSRTVRPPHGIAATGPSRQSSGASAAQVCDRRRPARERLGPNAHGAALPDRERRVRRESPPGLRRGRRRRHRERQAAWADHAPTGDRAVTPEDFEQLAREAAPELARVECIPATDEDHAGEARVLVIPKVSADGELGSSSLCRRWT